MHSTPRSTTPYRAWHGAARHRLVMEVLGRGEAGGELHARGDGRDGPQAGRDVVVQEEGEDREAVPAQHEVLVGGGGAQHLAHQAKQPHLVTVRI